MMDPFTFIRSTTNLRTAVLTMLTWCLVSPARAGESVTGVMAMSAVETFPAPCATSADSTLTFSVWPMPYGVADLTRSAVTLSTTLGTFGIVGVASSSWVDLSCQGAEYWRVTSAYRLGAAASVRWMQAAGFPSLMEGRVRLHAAADLDSLWTIGIGVDDLLYTATADVAPQRLLRLGAAFRGNVTFSADLVLGPQDQTTIILCSRFSPINVLDVRLSIRTEPLTASLAVRTDLPSLTPIIITFDHVQHLGLRSSLSVALP